MNTTLVIGIGNTLRGDDGAGVRVVERLATLVPTADCVTVQQLYPELAETLTAYDRVYFVDASLTATTIACSRVTCSRIGSEATHGLTPAGVLSLCASLYDRAPEIAILVEVPAEQFELGSAISERTIRMVDAAVDAVRRELSSCCPENGRRLVPNL